MFLTNTLKNFLRENCLPVYYFSDTIKNRYLNIITEYEKDDRHTGNCINYWVAFFLQRALSLPDWPTPYTSIDDNVRKPG
jgi:hypothetical protein